MTKRCSVENIFQKCIFSIVFTLHDIEIYTYIIYIIYRYIYIYREREREREREYRENIYRERI